MTRMLKAGLFVAAVSLLASGAEADNYTCHANPAGYLGVNKDGVVYTWIDNVGVVGICGLGAEVNSVNPDACRAWYSSLLTWRSTGKSASLYFNPDDATVAGATSCASFSPWTVKTPYFLEAAQ